MARLRGPASTTCRSANAPTRASGSARDVDSRTIVAVVPFGARGTPRTGAWARQIARRLVERSPADAELQLRPVFLVAMAEETSGEGHLIFGSTPTPELAAQYGASLGAARVVAGTYREDEDERTLDLFAVDVATGATRGEQRFVVPPGELHLLE